MTPEKQAELDQAVAQISDNLASLWWRLFSECKERGFTETQALALVIQHIATTCK